MSYELWAWLVQESDGTEGVITAGGLINGTFANLQSRQRALAERMRPLAEAHAEASGRPVRLAHLIEQSEPGP